MPKTDDKYDFLGDKARTENLKAFNDWLTKHKKDLAPKTGLGVIYAGQKIVGKMLPSGILIGGAMKPNPQPMWQFIKHWNAMHKKVYGQVRYETLEDVLKRLPGCQIKWTKGKATGRIKIVGSMYDAANDLSSDKEDMLDKAERKKLWDRLSKVYVSNIKGKLAVLEGVKKDFKRLDETKIMIRTELPELMKNPELAPESKEELKKLYASYKAVYEKQNALGKEIDAIEKHLKKKPT